MQKSNKSKCKSVKYRKCQIWIFSLSVIYVTSFLQVQRIGVSAIQQFKMTDSYDRDDTLEEDGECPVETEFTVYDAAGKSHFVKVLAPDETGEDTNSVVYCDSGLEVTDPVVIGRVFRAFE